MGHWGPEEEPGRHPRIIFLSGIVGVLVSLSWFVGQIQTGDSPIYINAVAGVSYAIAIVLRHRALNLARHVLTSTALLHVFLACGIGAGTAIHVHYWNLVMICGPFLIFRLDQRLVCQTYAALSLLSFIVIENALLGEAVLPPVGLLPYLQIIKTLNIVSVGGCLYLLVTVFVSDISKAEQENERLLLNILPRSIVRRLRGAKGAIVDSVEQATVLFADIVGFTPLAAQLPPEELVDILGRVFSAFDETADALGLEKVKTIGDAYMVASGVPNAEPGKVQAEKMIAMAQRMLVIVEELADGGSGAVRQLQLRIGIHSGPLVAGVIGTKKFAYDLWGDTVNTAARLESHGSPGRIHVSLAIREQLDDCEFESRGVIDIKGKGRLETFFVAPPRQRKKLLTEVG